jgi:hypothetical protein
MKREVGILDCLAEIFKHTWGFTFYSHIE